MRLIERLFHCYVLRHEQSSKDLSRHFIDTEGQLHWVVRCKCGKVWAK